METKEMIPLAVGFLSAAVALFSLWWQKKQERLTVNRAILGEVSRLIAVICRHRYWWEKERVPGDIPPLIPFSTDVFDRLADKLGYLDPEIVADVENFYGFVKFLNEVQKTRSRYGSAGRAEFEKLYTHNLDVVADAYDHHFDARFEKKKIKRPDEQPIVGGSPRATASPAPPSEPLIAAAG